MRAARWFDTGGTYEGVPNAGHRKRSIRKGPSCVNRGGSVRRAARGSVLPYADPARPSYSIRAMPLPIVLAGGYLAVNFTIMVWLEFERASGRGPTARTAALSHALRYGPPLLGLFYLVTIAGDWAFFLFVLGFFAIGSWTLNGLLAFTEPRRGSEAMRNVDLDDRNARASSGTDRDRPA